MKDYDAIVGSYLNGNSVKAELKTKRDIVFFLITAHENMTGGNYKYLLLKMQEWF